MPMATEESCLGSAPCDSLAGPRSSAGPELGALGERAQATAGDGTLAAFVCLRRLDAHPDAAGHPGAAVRDTGLSLSQPSMREEA
jgi:hypothetical protein